MKTGGQLLSPTQKMGSGKLWHHLNGPQDIFDEVDEGQVKLFADVFRIHPKQIKSRCLYGEKAGLIFFN
jgi:hypothetical protein